MHQLYRTIPTGEFKQNPSVAFKMAEDGPVVVMSRATPAAVMVSPDEWNRTAERLQYLERIVEMRKREMEMRNGAYDTDADLDA